ncbi:MAG TPA: aminotransferase class V-fold PLP-dependent enzyme [Acidimicrobiales bacterium]|nr:aminotransferase class V-fold PLP-dependent enzyme [Acidimicrobiales bacterium]
MVAAIPRDEIVGIDERTPVLDGRWVPYVNLDNAATTPALRSVVDAVADLLPIYGSVHRGTGYKSRVTTAAYEKARQMVGAFVGADPVRDVVVFGKNTTDAVNMLAGSLAVEPGSVVLTTLLEHHSNDLPWRDRARVVHVGARSDGTLDEDDLDRLLARHAGRVALAAVSGASNVTGVVPPVHAIAERVHAAGGRILVDAAQLAAHRRIDMRPHDDPGHLDFVVLSAHKAYAPFGTGALIGRRDGLGARPYQPGGGTVRAVTVADVLWADLPDRHEGGSPNVVGAVALAAAVTRLAEVGLDRIADHEQALVGYALARLAGIPGLRLYGPVGAGAAAGKVGVVPFTLDGLDPALVAAVLAYEHGIGVRSGCFCAQPYIAHLLGYTPAEVLSSGAAGGVLGTVRISLGAYNDTGDLERAVEALALVAAGEVLGTYDPAPDGSWAPRGFREPAAAVAVAG